MSTQETVPSGATSASDAEFRCFVLRHDFKDRDIREMLEWLNSGWRVYREFTTSTTVHLGDSDRFMSRGDKTAIGRQTVVFLCRDKIRG